MLGAVPLRPDGECWLVAAPHALLRLGHSDGEAGALPAPALDSLITQVRELDMDELKAKIAEEEAASGAQA